jgi:DNA-binding transcriptional MerR regulator
MRNGITGERYEQGRPKLFSYRVLELVDELRAGGLSFKEIAMMVEVNEEQLRTAVRHHRARLKRKKIKDRSSLEGLKAVKLVKPIITRRDYHNELDDSNSSPASFLGL